MTPERDLVAAVAAALGRPADVDAFAAALSDAAGHPIDPARAVRLAARYPDLFTVDGATVTPHVTPEPTPQAATPTGDGDAADGADDADGADPAGTQGVRLPARAVAIDFETHVVETVDGPLLLPWQVGCRRFGTDTAWRDGDPTFVAWMRLPAVHWPTFAHHRKAADVDKRGRDPAAVATELAGWLDGCDVLVAYNGFEVDFPVLDRLCGRDATADVDRIDGLYVAHALWPARHSRDASHRLLAAAARAGVDVDESAAHDAGYDADVLAAFLQAAARRAGRLDGVTRRLVAAVGRTSPTWRLLAALAGGTLPLQPLDRGDARAALDAALPLPAVRPDPAAPPPAATVTIPGRLRRDGQVDPGRLAVAGSGGAPEPRPAQQEMAAFLRRLVDDRAAGAVEAPTGTGKTDALLAVALEWLDRHPDNRVVIATYTKQLQRQLAGKIHQLDGHVGGLRAATDLVKGARNRLSLRAVAAAVVACAADAPPRGGIPTALRDNPAFRDLLLYLLLRLQLNDPARGTPTVLDEWESRSVDVSDLPGAADAWTGGRTDRWLAELSQGRTGDFPYRTDTQPLSARTRRAAEAAAASRLVIANHALLLTIADTLSDLGDRLLLLVDEAHRIEDAATSAFTPTFTYGATVHLARDVTGWTAAALPDGHPGRAAAARLAAEVESDVPARQAAALLDLPGPGEGSGHLRRVTLATGLGVDEAAAADLEGLTWSLHRLRQAVAAVYATLADVPAPADPADADAYWTLRSRVGDAIAQTTVVRDHLAELVDVTLPSPGRSRGDSGRDGPGGDHDGGGGGGDHAGGGGGSGDHDGGDDGDHDSGGRQLRFDDVTVGGEDAGDPPASGAAANRVVWLAQLDAPHFTGDNWTAFRFQVCSSPVLVGDEPGWQQILDQPAAVALTSATLTVPPGVTGDDPWRFLTTRLGLGPRLRRTVVASPFNFADQARLVCFSDFPSWTEQPQGALRTVVHQVAGYLDHVTDTGPDGAVRHGAMVLTTATATAAETAEGLRRHAAGDGTGGDLGRWRVHAATLDGNQPAVDHFKGAGGVLVGTKGLWQGVDVDQPDRLSMVWINKLPFPPFADPVIAARRAYEAAAADLDGHADPDHVAAARYYLPLGAIDLKQAVGRLIRTADHRGVIVISDRKLAGATRLRRLYRRVFLGGLEHGLVDGHGTDPGAGQITTMEGGWATIWRFLADVEKLERDRAAALSTPDALARQVWLPQTLAIRQLAFGPGEEDRHRAAGTLAGELVDRVAAFAGHKDLADGPVTLRDRQRTVLTMLAAGDDVCAVLPTGYGKSLLYQGPAMVLDGVTVVVSPLVSLMHDQALDLNRTVGGAVRALVAPMRESNSRLGKSEIAEQLTDPGCRHGIRLIYLSPERLGHTQFQQLLAGGVARGIIRRIALDEAHTWATWGDDFRPSFRRAEVFLDRLKADHPDLQLLAVTATATHAVRDHLETRIFARSRAAGRYRYVTANPVRPELAVYRRRLTRQRSSQRKVDALVERVATHLDGHAILYCTTIRQVDTVYRHLRTIAGRHRLTVLRYHGQLDEVAKTAAIQAFRDAPTDRDDADWRPTVVVATTAFGLGIDRADVRHVMAVSPPTDLAALYQMLGRAGRDMRRLEPGTWRVATTAMAVITDRNVHTLQFMLSAGSHDRAAVIDAAARHICRDADRGVTATVSLRRIGDRLLAADVDAGVVDPTKADDAYVVTAYRTVAGRVYAALADAGTVADLGDIPRRAALQPPEVAPAGADAADVALTGRILAAADRVCDGRGGVDLARLWDALDRATVADVGNLATLWAELTQLHTVGVLDVSQAPNVGHGYVTAFRRGGDVPGDLTGRVTRHHAARVDDLRRLVGWFNDVGVCCNRSLARYFGRDDVPDHTCSHARWACSDCLTRRRPDGAPPPIWPVFTTPDAELEPLAAAQTARADRLLDRTIVALLAAARSGLTRAHLQALLRGEATWWQFRAGRPRPVDRRLARHRAAGRHRGLPNGRFNVAVGRLVDAGDVVDDRDGPRLLWHPDRLADRRRRQAAS